MLYQQCCACHSEWNAIKMVSECPFCGNAFEMQSGDFKSIEDAFRYIICTHGIEIIKQKSAMASLLADYAPTLEKERRVVKMALEAGVYSELMAVSKTDKSAQSAVKAKAVNKLNQEYLLDQIWAQKAVSWFVAQLGWDLQDEGDDGFAFQNDHTSRFAKGPSAEKPVKETIHKDKGIQIGGTVEFGSYPYDENGTYRKLRWTILDINDGKVLLWCKECVDSFYYNRVRTNTEWRYCDLRGFLNNAFFDTAFKGEEKNAVKQVENLPSENSKTKRKDVRTTTDKVFILSEDDIWRYKLTEQDLVGVASPWAKKKGIYCSRNSDAYYWVRTPGSGELTQMFVGADGKKDEIGNYVDQENRGVRPAVWVEHSALKRLSKK